MQNTVVVTTTTYDIVITEETGVQTVVTTPDVPTIVTAVTAGPQGPPGAAAGSIRDLQDVDLNNAINNSLLYIDATTNKVLATDTWTTEKITDGGNF
jgi:hypothetical protein